MRFLLFNPTFILNVNSPGKRLTMSHKVRDIGKGYMLFNLKFGVDSGYYLSFQDLCGITHLFTFERGKNGELATL